MFTVTTLSEWNLCLSKHSKLKNMTTPGHTYAVLQLIYHFKEFWTLPTKNRYIALNIVFHKNGKDAQRSEILSKT